VGKREYVCVGERKRQRERGSVWGCTCMKERKYVWEIEGMCLSLCTWRWVCVFVCVYVWLYEGKIEREREKERKRERKKARRQSVGEGSAAGGGERKIECVCSCVYDGCLGLFLTTYGTIGQWSFFPTSRKNSAGPKGKAFEYQPIFFWYESTSTDDFDQFSLKLTVDAISTLFSRWICINHQHRPYSQVGESASTVDINSIFK